MQKLGDFQFSFHSLFSFSKSVSPVSFLENAGKMLLEILDFEEKQSCNFSANLTEDELAVLKVSRVKKHRFKCPDIWGNKFVSLFVHKPVNLHCILDHARNSKMKKRIGETILLVNEFLRNRPEFDKQCCHTMVLLASYRIACISCGDQERLEDFLRNFPVNCSTADFKKILLGFMESIECSLNFSEKRIFENYKKSRNHFVFSSLVYNSPSLQCTI